MPVKMKAATRWEGLEDVILEAERSDWLQVERATWRIPCADLVTGEREFAV